MRLPGWAYTAGWAAIAGAFAALETLALIDPGKGDTLSEHVWGILDFHPLAWFLGAGGLIWMVRHFLFKKG